MKPLTKRERTLQTLLILIIVALCLAGDKIAELF